MNWKKITSTSITILLPIIGFFGGKFEDELINIVFGKSDYKYLEGFWVADWKEDPCNEIPKKITLPKEHIEITHVYGKLIYGYGVSDSYGKYQFKGKISDSTIVLTYEKIPENADMPPGVVILTIDGNSPKVLEGLWDQNKNQEIVHGKTTWNRLN